MVGGIPETGVTAAVSNYLMRFTQISKDKGDNTLQFSFVTKLVAFHDETKPLYDKFVRYYFGLGAPRVGPIDFRIAGFVNNLNQIAQRYETWAAYGPFVAVIEDMRKGYPGLANCHVTRICDFLVSAVGGHKIGAPKSDEY